MRLSLPLFAATFFLATAAWAAADESSNMAVLLPPPVLEETAPPRAAAPSAAGQVAVPVLKQPVRKGEMIAPDNVTLENIPSSQAFASTITRAGELIGQQAVRPLGANQPVNRLHVRVAPLVSKNQLVSISYRKGGIELTGRGQALEDGQLGQSIRVANPTTKTTLVGIVATGGVVQIN